MALRQGAVSAAGTEAAELGGPRPRQAHLQPWRPGREL